MTTTRIRNLLRGILAIGPAALVLVMSGCAHPGPDPESQEKQVQYAKSLRNYFDEVHGDYAQLSDAEKQAYVKLCGSQKKADENWQLMKNGPGGGGASSAAPQPH